MNKDTQTNQYPDYSYPKTHVFSMPNINMGLVLYIPDYNYDFTKAHNIQNKTNNNNNL